MALQQWMASVPELLANQANVKTVYGEPVSAGGRTVIPVARIGYGFGGGGGAKRGGQEGRPQEEGGGGGGGMGAVPLGVVEISEAGTRWLPFRQTRPLAAAFGAGVLVGLLLRRGRS